MKNSLFLLVLSLIIAVPALGQEHRGGHAAPRSSSPRANGGHVPPAPTRRADVHSEREVEKLPSGHVNETQHVRNDHWYGHDRPDDARFHLDHPFEHGRFEHFGPSFRYRVIRFDPRLHRFWFSGGFFFEVADWDWPLCEDWCWSCGDDYVVYEDPDHIGWYLLYNVHTGVYVHVQYLGL